jgi:phosphatidylglycerophosphate synthase
MANIVTLMRFPLLFVFVAFLYTGNATIQIWSVPFIVVILMLDMFDGMIARLRGEVSLLGSVLDIATDRSLEIILWVVFAHLGLIPIVIPIIVITRGTTVDAVRAIGMRNGKAAFDQVKHPISRFLVSSRWMRNSYGVVKTAAFTLLTLSLGLQTLESQWYTPTYNTALVFSWVSILFTIVRGLPVLIEGYDLLEEPLRARKKDQRT